MRLIQLHFKLTNKFDGQAKSINNCTTILYIKKKTPNAHNHAANTKSRDLEENTLILCNRILYMCK